MGQINKFQVAVAIFMGSLFTALGYEIKDIIHLSNITQSTFILSISFVLSSVAAPVFVDLLVKSSLVRRLLFRDNWIEGYWYNTDLSPSEISEEAFNITAITEIRFKDPSLGFQTIGHRIKDEQEIYTFSQYVLLVGSNNAYVNLFNSSAKGAFRNLIAAGYFYRSPGGECLDTYDGVIVELEEKAIFRQRAKKIPDKVASQLCKKYGKRWVRTLLCNPEEQAHIMSGMRNGHAPFSEVS
ncbi:MAG: hypothetical protein AAGN15_07995 [Cyanobacteria bacterium J06581_3]